MVLPIPLKKTFKSISCIFLKEMVHVFIKKAHSATKTPQSQDLHLL